MEGVFSCTICNRNEFTLAQLYLELQEDTTGKCKEKLCSECIKEKRDCKCGLKFTDHRSRFKHRTIDNFQKERKERQVCENKKKFLPIVLKQLHLEYLRNDRKYERRTDRLMVEYENTERAKENKHVVDIDMMEKRLPNLICQSNGGDGQWPSGYEKNRGKGICQIFQAFYGFTPNFI